MGNYLTVCKDELRDTSINQLSSRQVISDSTPPKPNMVETQYINKIDFDTPKNVDGNYYSEIHKKKDPKYDFLDSKI